MAQQAYLPPDKPRLVVGIIVEQLRFDQIEKFRDRMSENGIRKLINEGTFLPERHLRLYAYPVAPGYSTIATGTEPSYHGITSDNWYLPAEKRTGLLYKGCFG